MFFVIPKKPSEPKYNRRNALKEDATPEHSMVVCKEATWMCVFLSIDEYFYGEAKGCFLYKYEEMQKKRQAINCTNYKMSLAHLKNSSLSHCVAGLQVGFCWFFKSSS